jgi:transposase
MLSLSINCRYFLYGAPCDMRRSYDGLCAIVNGQANWHLLSGDVFIFINKRRNQIRLLRWEKDGFAIYQKRLQKGTFGLSDKKELEAWELQLLLEGIIIERVRRKPRFSLKKISGSLV